MEPKRVAIEMKAIVGAVLACVAVYYADQSDSNLYTVDETLV